MGTTGLEVRLHEGRERAEVNRVTWTLNEIVSSLRDIDQVHLLRGTRATWVIADMKHVQHEFVIRLEARKVPVKRDWQDMLVPVNALVDGALQLSSEPAVPSLFTPKVVTRIADLATPRNGIQSVSVATYNGQLGDRVELTDAVQHNAKAAVQAFEVTYGSVAGRVSRLFERRGAKVGFTVRQEGGRAAVEGEAPGRLAEDLRLAWRHRVLLGGKLKRNSRGQIIRIDVDRLELLPEDDSRRPRSEELFGAVPHWAGELGPEEWMKATRRG